MGQFTAIETLGTFHVPAFDIALEGGTKLDRLKWDVIDVSYSDDTEALDSFEFSLADWDPMTFEPVYSSPYDSSGALKSYSGQNGKQPVPLLVPGTVLTLSMGYLDTNGPLDVMLKGKVVSLSSSFPAAGVPVAKVRVLNPLADFEKATLTGKTKGGILDVLKAVADQLSIGFDDSAVPADIKAAHKGQSEPETLLTEFKPVVDIRRLSRAIGMNARLVQGTGGDTLTLAPQSDVAYGLGWGKTLLSFTPTISTKQLVSRVIVRGHNPLASAPDKQKFEAKAEWSDLTLVGSPALGSVLIADVIKGLGTTQEVIDKPNLLQNLNATETAKARLRQLGAEMIRGAGQTVGLPLLRAGARVEITGVGSSFTGIYEVTKTTHALGASGYSTSFDARKEIFA